MKYAFRFTAAAQRQLRAIDRPAAMRVLAALTALGDDLYREDADIRKPAGPSGLYWIRFGSYRVAYQVLDGELLILVVKVADRRDAYSTGGRSPCGVLAVEGGGLLPPGLARSSLA